MQNLNLGKALWCCCLKVFKWCITTSLWGRSDDCDGHEDNNAKKITDLRFLYEPIQGYLGIGARRDWLVLTIPQTTSSTDSPPGLQWQQLSKRG